MSEHSALAKAICHDVVEANIGDLPRQQQFLIVREKVDAILEAYPEDDYRKLEKLVSELENPWIPVSERLPESDVVGVCADISYGQIESMSAFGYGQFKHIHSGLEAHNYDGGAVITLDFKPTHWQPITPPKG